MSKIILILTLCLICMNGVSLSAVEDIKDFIKSLYAKAKDRLDKLIESKTQTNITEILELEKQGIESISQSAQIMKLNGLKDGDIDRFLNSFVGRLKLPEEHMKNVTESLHEIVESKTEDWSSYKYVYSKNVTNSTLYYMSILAQHDVANKKSNWIYTEMNTNMNQTDVFIISKTKKVGYIIKEEIEVVRKPSEYNSLDIELMLQFLEVASVKAFESYLGVKDVSRPKLVYMTEFLQ